ncbi:hypothetical protein NBRC10512_003215 [Rhodotorula toruloides]|uniref:RHTO0S05e07734g1_1 n=2 Tax=Rhodotorula toruloides TaxID=5286 RepID=A0A061ATB8_RHOTO|nr:RNA-binding protein [Rhodotorula toruloides NP11]EMS23808.1 RNA-binding protein [Rhodotorula toruloides NP11]CDR40832.1 RHTO0S05e07734g1_1 [Rhodotorula toruloides]
MSAPAETASSSTAPAEQQQPAIAQAMQATPQELGHKVFVGNLPFDATDESIKEIFGKVGQVTDAQIIHRGRRSLGYGFVTYTSESDAASAVSQLDKSEISGRQVNVEVAKPMPVYDGPPAARAPRKAAKKAAEVAATRETAQEAAEGEGEARPKKARKPRTKTRGPRAPRNDEETEEAGDAPVGNSAVSDAADQLANTHLEDGAAPRARKPRTRKPRARKTGAEGEVSEGAGEGEPPALGAAKPRQPRQPRRRGPPSTGVESQTLIFVGNLHFSVTNEMLAAAFPECKVKSAVVVTLKFGQKAGRSKGFAFVDFETHEDQLKALEKYQGTELEGRQLNLKVAIQPEGGEGQGAEQAAAREANEGDAAESNAAPPVPESNRTEGDAIIVAS